ncbi:MAG: endonuclease/exonuclease/phosphatase family protein [Nocardioides sp.]
MTWRRGLFWALVAVLLAPALTLTALRLSDPPGGLLIRIQSLTPLALLPYAFVLVLLGAWSVRHRRHVWVVLVPLAGIGLHLHWLAPMYTGATPPPDPQATPWVVMTVNLHYGEGDADQVVQDALREKADVLVLEEITPSELVALDRAGLSVLLPHHAGTPLADDAGTMLFAKGRVTGVVNEPTVFRSLLATVHTPDGPKLVLAVHPSPPTARRAWVVDHRRLMAIAHDARPDLIVGDFNATLDQVPMRDLEDEGYRSAGELTNQGWQPTWPANGLYHVLRVLPLPPVAEIDHVMVGPGLTAIGSHTLHVADTDHRAVVATVASE